MHAGRLNVLLAHARCLAELSARLAAVCSVATLPMTFHGRVAVLPVVSIVAAIGVGIAGSEVLAICVRIELRAIAGVFDNRLRECRSYGSRCYNSGGAD